MNNSLFINGVMLPLFMTWFLPNSIRNVKTGEYLGMNNVKSIVCVLLILFMQTNLILDKYAMSTEAVLRIGICVLIPIAGAHLFVKYTQKELFGREIMFTKWW